MRAFLFSVLFSSTLGLAACGSADRSIGQPNIDIQPTQFVLLPCGELRDDQPCALAVAGGKRVLFGAPAGITRHLSPDDLKQLDAVMLFSLRAADIEGLDEVRNESWRAGRDTPLLTVGPNGVEEFVTALNKAFEQADALRIVEHGIPPGGYDAAVLVAQEVLSGQTAFDTGDLNVVRTRAGYLMTYEAAIASLEGCGADQRDALASEVTLSIGCSRDSDTLEWPVTAPIFVVE